MADLGLIGPSLLPQLDAVASRLASKDSKPFLNRREESRIGLRVSWELDLWGITRLRREALVSALDVAVASGQRVLLDLSSEMIRALLDHERSAALAALNRDEAAAITSTLSELDRRVALGVIDSIEAAQLRSELDELQAEIVRLDSDARNQRELIHTLLGRQGELPPLPQEVLARLPVASASFTVAACLRRPEVRAAELAVQRDGASLEAARRSILPSFSLSADAGLAAVIPSRVLASGTGAWQFLANATLPLLDAGTYKYRWMRARAELRRSEAAYAEALAEGLDRLARGQTLLIAYAERREALERALASANAVADEIAKRITAGTVDVAQYLDATRRALRLRRAALEARYDSASIWVDLQAQVAAPPVAGFTERCDELLLP